MADDISTSAAATDLICPWCSAALPSADAVNCPSCGATLISETEAQVPGVTAIDAEAIIKGARAANPPRRNRLLSWISGEVEVEQETPLSNPESLAPPPEEVRREMLRMEIAAEISDLQAEVESMVADEEIEARDAGVVPPDQPLDGSVPEPAGEVPVEPNAGEERRPA